MLREQKEQGIISEGEFRKGMIEKIINFFEKAHIFEKVQELLKAEKIKDVISFEEFRDFLIRVNGVVREIPIKDRGTDGQNIYMGGSADITYFPYFEDRQNLLSEVYESIDKVKKEDLKYFVPLMITAIHLFKDGNGRTSRIFNLLFSDSVSGEDLSFELEKVLGLDGRYIGHNINPSYIDKEVDNYLINKYGLNSKKGLSDEIRISVDQGLNILDHEMFDDINTDNEGFLDAWGTNKKLANMVIILFLQEKGILQKCMTDDVLNIKLVNKYLNKEDWMNLESNFYKSLKEKTEILIDIFVKPEEYHVEPYNPTTLKDLLITRINRQKE